MTTTRRQREQPRVRLLWDEQLSSLVAKALRVLEFRVTWIGAPDAGVPPRGSTDAAVVEYAQRTNQVVVTTNHDMMTLCAQVGQRFVWLDPRGRQLSRPAQVLLVFQQIDRWQQLLIRLSIAGLYHARWSERILNECFDNLLADRPDLSAARINRTRPLMSVALPEAAVTDDDHRANGLTLPDPRQPAG